MATARSTKIRNASGRNRKSPLRLIKANSPTQFKGTLVSTFLHRRDRGTASCRGPEAPVASAASAEVLPMQKRP